MHVETAVMYAQLACSMIAFVALFASTNEVERRFKRYAWRGRFTEAETLNPEVNGQPL